MAIYSFHDPPCLKLHDKTVIRKGAIVREKVWRDRNGNEFQRSPSSGAFVMKHPQPPTGRLVMPGPVTRAPQPPPAMTVGTGVSEEDVLLLAMTMALTLSLFLFGFACGYMCRHYLLLRQRRAPFSLEPRLFVQEDESVQEQWHSTSMPAAIASS